MRELWSFPSTRKSLLNTLEKYGFSFEDLIEIQKIINAQGSDIFDVLEFVAFAKKPISRKERVSQIEKALFHDLNEEQISFVNFILDQYVDEGIDALDDEKLPTLLEIKYSSIQKAKSELGDLLNIRKLFINLQTPLYNH